MKKLLIVVAVLSLLLVASDMPPQLPSSFYGTITPAVKAGTPVSAWVDGVRVMTKLSMVWEGQSVYAMNIRCNEGDLITFRIRGKVYGIAVCHIGTAVEFNLKR